MLMTWKISSIFSTVIARIERRNKTKMRVMEPKKYIHCRKINKHEYLKPGHVGLNGICGIVGRQFLRFV